LCRYDQTLIEQYDSYQKQTYRNRCVIATANGLQALTVPVEHDTLNIKNEILKVKDLRISDHNNWRRIHWNALQSAYNESPFFDYYADDIRPFFEKKYEFLVDFNEAIRQTVCNLLDIHPQVSYTTDFSRQPSDIDDYREVINAKHPQADEDFQPRRYWQVFEGKHGFQSNLSILDLLFNMGNEAVFYL
jgi:hypothetical protein